MKREDIEKAAVELPGLRFFSQEIAAFAIERVNAALEEAAIVMWQDGYDWSGYIRNKILALKIK